MKRPLMSGALDCHFFLITINVTKKPQPSGDLAGAFKVSGRLEAVRIVRHQ